MLDALRYTTFRPKIVGFAKTIYHSGERLLVSLSTSPVKAMARSPNRRTRWRMSQRSSVRPSSSRVSYLYKLRASIHASRMLLALDRAVETSIAMQLLRWRRYTLCALEFDASHEHLAQSLQCRNENA